MQQDRKLVLLLWFLRCLRASIAHYHAAMRHKGRDRVLTIVNVVSSIVVLCTSVGKMTFEKFITIPDEMFTMTLTIASVFVVISSVLQYILDGNSLSASHHEAGIKYANLRREIEVLMSKGCSDEEFLAIKGRINDAADTSALAPRDIWRRSEKLDAAIREIEDDWIKMFKANVEPGP